jgi:hypothetical protein
MPNSNVPAVMVRSGAFRELGRFHGMRSARAWATRMDVAVSTVTRTVNGEVAASGGFIARVLTIFPDVAFESIFFVGDPGDAIPAPDWDDANDAELAAAG